MGLGVAKLLPKIARVAEPVATKVRRGYYDKAPWTWKPDPNSFYRVGSRGMAEDALNAGVVRAKPTMSKMEIAIAEGRTPTLMEKLDAGSRAKGNTYFSKGEPLSSKFSSRYSSRRSSNYGDYIIESKSPNFKEIGPKGREMSNPRVGNEIVDGASAVPIGQLTKGNYNVLEPNWFYGFKRLK